MKQAYVEIAGFQFNVKEGDRLVVPKLNAKPGETVGINRVLYLRENEKVFVGTPYVKGALVKLEVLGIKKLPKILVFKYKRRKNYRRRRGHRQQVSEVYVKEIVLKERVSV